MANSSDIGSKYVIVVGTSAGGLSALKKLLAHFNEDFPVPILIVQHISADAVGNVLVDNLTRSSKLKVLHPKSGDRLLPGSAYIAASDHHLMIDEDKKILITKGAHENRSRPAINPLFRSAAVSYGSGVIGILLTGYLDDGTAGLEVIKRCGGICIVQDPNDADYPDMPQNAINKIKPDYILPIAEMGGIIYQLIAKNPAKQRTISKDILIETAIATRVTSDLASVNTLGSQVPFNCPGCGGVLWKVGDGESSRFRCHTGHAYTAATLLAEQTMKIEETMWTALRMFEERKNLLDNIAQGKSGATSKSAQERSAATQEHIERIRHILLADDKGTDGDVPV
ncbi:two-component system chemotaxis response regulator CheB [Flavobacterium sp. 270]|uniref:chemotaxis protein CheB n=1 Tax=Flavobacterium sp. 270 TaxID=2512114 RepID=UPI00106556B1|nr:chemotaxis protein CheB [Flavobacterium sp. 270]TDW46665.1 two-component system chemotaxis response regulator CheB [Flavobacterium sp. 270]